MKKLDTRTNRISEVIDNIKLIKFNSWTDKFLEKVFEARSSEIKAILKKYLLWTINIAIIELNYPILGISVFLTAIFGMKMAVTVPTALAIIQILNSLNTSLNSISRFIGGFVAFLVSLERIQNFFKCEQIERNAAIQHEKALGQVCIKINNSNLFWGLEEH